MSVAGAFRAPVGESVQPHSQDIPAPAAACGNCPEGSRAGEARISHSQFNLG
ncbi:MAG: hypothetical protein MUC60_03535 [Oscillatoria sp. Prado101]|nr:hypothetical protein [Oscillatoria sp. Prado101]